MYILKSHTIQVGDYRNLARAGMTGRWGCSIITALAATLLGGVLVNPSLYVMLICVHLIQFLPHILAWILSRVILVMIPWFMVQLVVGGMIRQGYTNYLLKQQRNKAHQVKDIFSQCCFFRKGFALVLQECVLIFLWTLLLVLPSVIASYRYAMAPFILLEHPETSAAEAIHMSKNMMRGKKWELFCLDLSFIGWFLLSVLTLGIGFLWLTPYINAARTNFYLKNNGPYSA